MKNWKLKKRDQYFKDKNKIVNFLLFDIHTYIHRYVILFFLHDRNWQILKIFQSSSGYRKFLQFSQNITAEALSSCERFCI